MTYNTFIPNDVNVLNQYLMRSLAVNGELDLIPLGSNTHKMYNPDDILEACANIRKHASKNNLNPVEMVKQFKETVRTGALGNDWIYAANIFIENYM